MFMQFDCGRRSPAVLLLAVLALGGAATPLQAQTNAAAPQDSSAKVPAYEVVSIKLASPGDRNSGWKDLPNGLDYTNMPLVWLIYSAYGIRMDSQISGLPEWVKADRYSVSARVDEDTAEVWKKLSKKELQKQQQVMLQAMLADRCQLTMRREVKELPVYDLVIAKGGLKMKEAAQDEKESSEWKQTALYSATSQGDEFTIVATTHAGTIPDLAQSLPNAVGRVIVDKTGLGDERFDFELRWSSSDQAPSEGGGAGPPIFKALEEQLGLQLVPAKEPVDTFVVEHMERPSAN
ncbi:MAG: TIGR03435 family protein [Terracidiphilus sp.]